MVFWVADAILVPEFITFCVVVAARAATFCVGVTAARPTTEDDVFCDTALRDETGCVALRTEVCPDVEPRTASRGAAPVTEITPAINKNETKNFLIHASFPFY